MLQPKSSSLSLQPTAPLPHPPPLFSAPAYPPSLLLQGRGQHKQKTTARCRC